MRNNAFVNACTRLIRRAIVTADAISQHGTTVPGDSFPHIVILKIFDTKVCFFSTNSPDFYTFMYV